MNEASNKEKITESKERGLRPLLRFMADKINQHIIWPINESFEFDFVGLDAMTQDQSADLIGKQVKTTRTIDELRAEDDLPPLPDGKGEIILDPTALQWFQIKDAAGMEGEEGEEGDMGEGESEGGEGGPPGKEGEEEEFDFEALMSEFEGDEDEDEDEDKKMAASMSGGKFLVDLDL